MAAPNQAESFQVDLLAFGAHPDDVECAAGGSILKHTARGRRVAIVDLSAGELGSYGTPESRRTESLAAAALLGVVHREQLGLADGALENDEASRLKVMTALRKFRPDIVLCNAIHDRHPDHANAARLVADACFLAGLRNKATSLEGVPQEAWRPRAVYHYIQDYFIQPDFVVDITAEMPKKMDAILAFKSQFVEPTDQAPNSILGLLDQIRSTNGIYGRPINAAFAEGFTVTRYLGVRDFFDLT